MAVDPLADFYPSHSPYNYVVNNAVNVIDPDGKGPVAVSLKAAKKAAMPVLKPYARRIGVRKRWKLERQLVAETGKGTYQWTAKQRNELLKHGKVKGFEGHHINSVAHNNLEMAMDPANIEFVKGRTEHLLKHSGNWANETSGPLIDRLSKLSGPALFAFFMAYDAKMKELHAESPLISDPTSWSSYINPFNYLVENIALIEGFIAAYNIENAETIHVDPGNARSLANDYYNRGYTVYIDGVLYQP